MKRRVSRAHSNKHELRVISAANKLPLDRFHVIVDASFLRAILQNYWQEYESLYKSRSHAADRRRDDAHSQNHSHANTPSSQKRFLSAYQYLRENIDEAFASSNVGSGSKMITPRSGAHPKTNVFYYHVSETATTLRRLLAQPPPESAATNPTTAADKRAASSSHSSNAPHQPFPRGARQGVGRRGKVFDTTRIPEEVIGDLLSRLQRRDADQVGSRSGPRNEGKAIGELVLCGLREGGYYFVASQSHDVRRLLPSRTGILRWTRQPNGVWLEQNGKEGLGDDACGAAPLTSSLALSAGGGDRRGRVGASRTGPRLSMADMAFMRHIGRGDHLPQSAPTSKAAAAPITNADGTGTGSPATATVASAGGAETVKPPRKRKRVHGSNPNPLSVKKKQKKEVFRID